MNKIASIILVGVLVAASSSADPQVNTPITPEFYTKLNTQCVRCCSSAAPATYCSCACNAVLGNAKGVVKQYSLKYAEELDTHYSEVFPNYKQINECKAKAGM